MYAIFGDTKKVDMAFDTRNIEICNLVASNVTKIDVEAQNICEKLFGVDKFVVVQYIGPYINGLTQRRLLSMINQSIKASFRANAIVATPKSLIPRQHPYVQVAVISTENAISRELVTAVNVAAMPKRKFMISSWIRKKGGVYSIPIVLE